MLVSRHRVVLTLALALVPAAVALGGTQERMPARIVILSRGAPPEDHIQAFREGLQELGHLEGQTYTIEPRYSGVSTARLRELAAEVPRSKPDIIFASHGEAAAAAKRASSSIPIVFTSVDPIALGLITSFARPSGHATGVATPQVDLSAKGVQLLRDAFPALKRVAVLFIPESRGSLSPLDGFKTAVTTMKVEILPVAVPSEVDLETAFETPARQRAGAITQIGAQFFRGQRARMVAFAARHRISAIYDDPAFVEEGGLMSYRSDRRLIYRRAAAYVDKILKGAKPADLPVEQPTKFELVINLKTAKALGLTIPQSLLSRADEVIQ